jgi:hypothetical protein
MPIVLGLFAGFLAFFLIAFGGDAEDASEPEEEYGWWD